MKELSFSTSAHLYTLTGYAKAPGFFTYVRVRNWIRVHSLMFGPETLFSPPSFFIHTYKTGIWCSDGLKVDLYNA